MKTTIHEELEKKFGKLPLAFYDLSEEELLAITFEYFAMSDEEREADLVEIRSQLSKEEIDCLLQTPESH